MNPTTADLVEITEAEHTQDEAISIWKWLTELLKRLEEK
jgi:hypothetical protein